ncbi:MAG: hypothetical protein HC925_06315, partial [Coleofasciculaceae cyanobacterium SM2_3_26]|nr:hypothetical protein [Coleofasciculaceae cyanobacterium SM2_3_26]
MLLVEGETPEAREQVQQAIPPALSATTCILNEDEVITRVSGFPSVAVANAWADYMASTTGLAAAVTRPGSLELATGLEVAPDALPDLADPSGSQSPTPADNSQNLQPVASRTSP